MADDGRTLNDLYADQVSVSPGFYTIASIHILELYRYHWISVDFLVSVCGNEQISIPMLFVLGLRIKIIYTHDIYNSF